MTFWQLKCKLHGDEAEMFFENLEQAMAFILDNYGVDIFDINLVEQHTVTWNTRIVLNERVSE